MPWPETVRRNREGELEIGGIGVSMLAATYGTPLYVFDEQTLRNRARFLREAFGNTYTRSKVAFAGKAYLSPALMRILAEEGLGLDVVSGGEIYAGRLAGVDPREMIFHGNNKSRAELAEAVTAGVGLIAIDNDLEIDLLNLVAEDMGADVDVVLRLNPGVDPHTHAKMRTGATDSKFGFPIGDGQAGRAARRVCTSSRLRLVGYHAHVGSQIFDSGLVSRTLDAVMDFAAGIFTELGVAPDVLIPGGGFGVADDATGEDVDITLWAEAVARAVHHGCRQYGFSEPLVVVEPGRAVIGPAAVALYEVGARKVIAGLRTYVAIDGGMADNIRPALYGARYSAALANRDATGEPRELVTIAGKYCESGDVLIEDAQLPALRPRDLLAVPMAGAYCLSMASNYNLAPRPEVVLVREGSARTIRRRESYADMMRSEVFDRSSDAAGSGDCLSVGNGSL